MSDWNIFMKFEISCLVIMMFCFPTCCHGVVEPPEIAILDQLKEVNFSYEKMWVILEAAQFLDDEQAVIRLLNHLRQLDCRDRKNFDTLILYRIVFEYMTCHPERLIIERLRAETDVWEKTKLIDLLRSFEQPEVFVALMEQFDDTRKILCEHCWQQRICEIAYTDVIFKLRILGFIKERQFGEVLGAVPEQLKEKYFAEFKAYWDANKGYLLQEIPKRKTPEYLQWRHKLQPKQEKPAQ